MSWCFHWFSSRYLSIAESMEATDVLNPALNYGIVVDCGSSGSRVFVYYWPPHNGNPHSLLDIRQMRDHNHKPVVKKIKPGEESELSWSCVRLVVFLVFFVRRQKRICAAENLHLHYTLTNESFSCPPGATVVRLCMLFLSSAFWERRRISQTKSSSCPELNLISTLNQHYTIIIFMTQMLQNSKRK